MPDQPTNPEDIRDAQFRALDPRALTGLRRRCYYELIERGPATTRALAARLGVDLLSVRPRVTELYQSGLVACDQVQDHEGVYRALSQEGREQGAGSGEQGTGSREQGAGDRRHHAASQLQLM